MPIDPTMQLVMLLREYFYFNNTRRESAYIQALDNHYRTMFNWQPEKFLTSQEIFDIMYEKAKYEEFLHIQDDVLKLLNLFEPGGI